MAVLFDEAYARSGKITELPLGLRNCSAIVKAAGNIALSETASIVTGEHVKKAIIPKQFFLWWCCGGC